MSSTLLPPLLQGLWHSPAAWTTGPAQVRPCGIYLELLLCPGMKCARRTGKDMLAPPYQMLSPALPLAGPQPKSGQSLFSFNPLVWHMWLGWAMGNLAATSGISIYGGAVPMVIFHRGPAPVCGHARRAAGTPSPWHASKGKLTSASKDRVCPQPGRVGSGRAVAELRLGVTGRNTGALHIPYLCQAPPQGEEAVPVHAGLVAPPREELICAWIGCQPLGWLCPCSRELWWVPALPGHESVCVVLAVTWVSQGQVGEADHGPSAAQGGLGVDGSLSVKEGVTATRQPGKVLPCSQNKQAVPGAAWVAARCPPSLSVPRVSPSLGWWLVAGGW